MHQFSAQQDAIGFFTNLVFNTFMAKQDDYSRYTIRVPQDVYAAIEKAAAQANRSVNAEIVERLDASVQSEELSHKELTEHVERLGKELKDARLMNALMGRMIGRSDEELHKHLVISKTFCLAVMRMSENSSSEIFHLSQEMFEVYDMEHEAIDESERIARLREVADVPEEELAEFDAESYLGKQLGLKETR